MNVKDFVKKLLLSEDEKLLIKHGLKGECGDYTQEAKDIVINKLVASEEKYLIEIATKKEAEDQKERK